MKFIYPTSLLILSLFLSSGLARADGNTSLLESAAGGDTMAQRDLGINYLEGINGYEKNYTEANKWLASAVSKGDKPASHALAIMYTFGYGVDKDYFKAEKLYIEAGDAVNGASYNNLGAFYERGLVGKPDPVLADKYLKLAASAGNPDAMYYLGSRYQYGKGVRRDYKKSFSLYKKAADKGYVQAMFALATLYDDGIGVKKDDKEAVKWYKKAADLGDVYAMNNLGHMLMHGEGIKKDYASARAYLEKAKDKGDTSAMANLGYIYLNGLGVKKNYQKASELYQESCDKGEKTGCDTVKEMKNKGTYRATLKQPKEKKHSKRLVATSIDEGVNATFIWQGDDASFKANNQQIDCAFLEDHSEEKGNLATAFVCTDNVQILLKQFKDSKNAYLAVMTDNFKTEVKKFSVNVYLTEKQTNKLK
ncbi:tetratricopeptide repeat protein [Pseudenterobacter timonensis]|uniref:tetratricopeptide repeat protein n=1 Tax=Pseudenterobacter timonensis TaxID=1755099 RepID=UPI00077B8059|nr:tetratricopeptide repeat protein [Pseudenterobacter timonensis]